MHHKGFSIAGALIALLLVSGAMIAQVETRGQFDARMKWWNEARFGLFIHWGLYSIPAGEWGGKTGHGEWIRTTAQIPIKEYDKFVGQFNPVKFNADEWVRMAKEAGMKYITITSKHHDGFCLFDSKYTDYDVMSTPFKRDIMKELSDACRRQGIAMCWYHSIMDWHHPDYLPRREWEKDRPVEGANFDRYVEHLKNQLKELVTKYGRIGVLWFDGEWESTWNPKYGREIYDYVRSLQPDIIINNRVGAGRSGMEGFTKEGEYSGDFGTPEQTIPATGIPGRYWETCMTMNDHWGYNSHDQEWKSPKMLLQMLADIASKGGNFLLNIGPTSEGVFPPASIERLRDMGAWMKTNGEAIYGSSASPFSRLEWGRCTQKPLDGGMTRLYLHVFDWPTGGKLIVPGIFNEAGSSYLLSDAGKSPLTVSRREDALVIDVPKAAPDTINSVVVLDIAGRPDVSEPPAIDTTFSVFVDAMDIALSSGRENVEIRYTLDGSVPAPGSSLATGPIHITQTTTVSARCFRDSKPVSGTAKATFTKTPVLAAKVPITGVRLFVGGLVRGLRYGYYEGDWDSLPSFSKLKAVKSGVMDTFSLPAERRNEYYGVEYSGYVRIGKDDVYAFSTESDDGSRLWIDGKLIVDNDGLHGMVEKRGVVALAAGFHAIQVAFFQKSGGQDLIVSYGTQSVMKQRIPSRMLYLEGQAK